MSEFKDVRLEMAVNHGSCKLITYEDWQSQGVVCVDGKMLPIAIHLRTAGVVPTGFANPSGQRYFQQMPVH
jgi:hypothetical protein